MLQLRYYLFIIPPFPLFLLIFSLKNLHNYLLSLTFAPQSKNNPMLGLVAQLVRATDS